MTRAKFIVLSVKKYHRMPGAVEIEMGAVYSTDPNHENRAFFTATPNADLKMTITNPAAAELFQLGEEYYVDFSPAPKSQQ
jgi:hypothetical protein